MKIMIAWMYKAIFRYSPDDKVDTMELLKAGIYYGEITSEEYQWVKEILNKKNMLSLHS